MLINKHMSTTYVSKSIDIIYKLVKVSAPFNAMCKNFELVPALLQILQDITHIEQHQTICSILYTLSIHEIGINQLFRGQSITCLLEQMEQSRNEKIVIYCSRILFNMQRQLKMSVTSTMRLAYGVKTITRVLVHKACFRIDDSSAVSYWLTPSEPRSYWSRAGSSQHQFENPPSERLYLANGAINSMQ